MISTKTVLFVLLAMLVAATATLRGERQGLLDLTKINDAHQLHAKADDPCMAEMSAKEKAAAADYEKRGEMSELNVVVDRLTKKFDKAEKSKTSSETAAGGSPGSLHQAIEEYNAVVLRRKEKSDLYEAAIEACGRLKIVKDAAAEAWKECCQKNKPFLGFSDHKSKGCINDKSWEKKNGKVNPLNINKFPTFID